MSSKFFLKTSWIHCIDRIKMNLHLLGIGGLKTNFPFPRIVKNKFPLFIDSRVQKMYKNVQKAYFPLIVNLTCVFKNCHPQIVDYCWCSIRVFPILVLKLGESIWLVELDKCFMDRGIYYLWIVICSYIMYSAVDSAKLFFTIHGECSFTHAYCYIIHE